MFPDLSHVTLTSVALTFTQEQYKQILELLHKVSPSDSTTNLAGIVSWYFSTIKHPTWVLDIGAIDHICFYFHSLLLPRSYALNSRFVYLPNGKHTSITRTGSFMLSPDFFFFAKCLICS